MRPKIGILLDYEKSGSFSSRPHYAIRVNYLDMIYKAGGFPIAIPYINKALDSYLNMIDGILIPGGSYPFEASWYIDNKTKSDSDPRRREADLNTVKKALDKNIPILGICAGMQVIAGLHGCKFAHKTKDVADPTITIDHSNGAPAEERAHKVSVLKNSLLHKITSLNSFEVNTTHSEAIATTTDKIIVSATAPDNIIEAIEIPSHRFALGVQWHPEFFAEEGTPDFNILKYFIKISSE